jgi:hypothetical protein
MIIGDMEIRLRADIARLQRDMDDARRVVGGAVNGIAEMAKMARGALIGMAAGISFAALVHQVVDAQREFDKLNASLITATGSTANAAVAFKALQSFASTTPYSVQEATEAFIKMRNLGLDPSERALRSYGNTAAAMGKGLNQMVEAVADAATGEFERLKEFGITAKQNGDRVALTFKGMTANIGNNAKEIQDYLRKIGETDFGGGMELRAATLDGAISNLGDTWRSVLRTIASNGIGEAMLSGVLAVSGALQDLSAILDAVGGAAGKEGQAVKEATGVHAILTTTFEALAVVGTNIAYVFQTIGKDIGAFAAQAVTLFSGGMKGLVDGSSLKAVQEIGRTRVAEAEQERKAVDAKSEAILGAAQKAQGAQDAETANLKKNTTDRLAQFQLVLTDEQKRDKALSDTLDLRNRLNGVNAQTAGELTKLKTSLDTGAISQAEYNRYVAQVNKDARENSTVYKNAVKQIDLQTSALQRQAAARTFDNQQAQLQIDFLKRTGQLNDEEAINKGADSDLKALRDQRDALEAEKKLQSGKIDNLAKVKELQGQIDQIGRDVDARELKRGNDLFVLEQQRYRQAVNNSADLIESEQAELASLKQQTQAQIDQNEQIGLTAKQIAGLTATRLEEAAARKDAESITAEGLDLTGERAERIREEAKAIRERAAAIVDGAAKQELYDSNLEQLHMMVDVMSALDAATQSAAQGMASAFGSVGAAIGSMTTALSGYERSQAAIAAQLAAATKDAHGDQAKIQHANAMAAEASAQAQIKSYGDMGAAAKGFFKENTAGYRAMEGVEKTFRAFEMAMALSNMAQKLGLVGTYTAAVVAGKQAETQAAVASVAPEVAAAQAKGMANAAAGVANQAGGDPYTAWARMAAMAAVMVGLGFAVSGGGSGVSLAQQRQAAQGTGSVLGDSDAKSESIKNALDLVEKNTYQGLSVNNSMLATLRSIDSNIASFASQLLQSTGVANPSVPGLNVTNGAMTNVSRAMLTMGGSAVGGMAGAGLSAFTSMGAVGGPMGMVAGAIIGYLASRSPLVGKITTAIFGGKQSIDDSGITLDRSSLASILAGGVHANSYADITTSGGWFRGDSNEIKTAPLGDEANAQFTAIIKSLAETVKQDGMALGLAGDEFTAKLNSFVVDIGQVSLKDLKGDDLQKTLESVFSKLGDQMATFAVGGLQQFQQVGEGYLETLTRLAVEYQTVDVVFQSFGKAFGAIGLASIEARDRLVQLAGGLEKFTSQGEYFLTNFFSEQEQAAALRKRIDPTLAQYGLSSAGENAAQAFRDFVVSLDTTTEAGAQAYATLMTIAPALKSVIDAEKDALDERTSLQEKLDELTMTSAELHEKEREKIKAVNLALYDRVAALQAEKDAASTLLGDVDGAFSVLQKVVEREKAAVQTVVNAHTAAVSKLQSLSQSLHSTLDSLKSPDQKLVERAVGQAQIRAALAIAKAGGVFPNADDLKDALSAVSQDASGQFSSYADYLRDLYQTQNDIAQLGDLTDDQLSVEQKALQAAQSQLDRLDAIVANGQAQIDAINGQSVATLSLAQAMAGLQTSLGSAQANPYVTATSGISQAYMQLLGRAPDAAGLAYWQQAVTSGMSLSQIRAFIEDSAEYKKLKGVPGFAGGGDFGGGVRLVGEVGPEIEATGPSRIHSTRALFEALSRPSSNNDALLAELKAVRLELAQLRTNNSAENVAQVKQLQATVDLLTKVIYGGESIQTKVAS